MKTSKAWKEEITFVACPECEETIELGVDVISVDGEEYDCEHCGTAFLIEDRGD